MGKADIVPDEKIIQLGSATLENKVNNVKSAQACLVKACNEVAEARAYLESAQLELANEINSLDCGVIAVVEKLTDTTIVEAITKSTK